MEVPKSLMRKKSKEDEQTLEELNSAHRRSPAKCQLVQTNEFKIVLVCQIINQILPFTKQTLRHSP